MHCRNPAGVAGIPGLQHIEGFGSPHLADDDAVGTQAKRGTHEVGEVRHAWLGAESHGILGIASELAGVLNDDNSFVEARDLRQKRVSVQLIGDHPHIVVASGEHPLARRDNLSPSDLAGEVFITREVGSGTRLLMEGLFEASNLNPKIGMEMGSNETVKQAVIAGLGIAFISAHTVASELDDGRLVTLDVKGLPVVRQWFVVRRKDKIMLPPAQAMLDFLRTQGPRYLPKLPRLCR